MADINFTPNNTSDLINIYPDTTTVITSGNSNYFLASTENNNVKEIKFKDEQNNRYSMHKYNSDIFKWGNHTIKDGFGEGIISYRSDGKPPVLSTTKSKFGGKSLYFDNINNSPCMLKINTPALYSETFTISFWINFDEYYNSSSEGEKILELDDNIVIQPYNSSGTWKLTFWIGNKVDSNSYEIVSFTPSINTWYNFTLCRNINTYYIFINGSLIYTKTYFGIKKLSNLKLFGEERSNVPYHYTQQPSGYLDELMICDSCLYTSNFNVRTTPYTENDLNGNYIVLHCKDDIINNTLSYNQSIINSISYYNNIYPYNDSTLFNGEKNIYINNSTAETNDNVGNIGAFCLNLKESLETLTVGFWYRKEADDGNDGHESIIRMGDIYRRSFTDKKDDKTIFLLDNITISSELYNVLALAETLGDGSNSSYYYIKSNYPSFTIGEWHYINVIKTSSHIRLYIDGNFIFSKKLINTFNITYIEFGQYNGWINNSSSYGDIYISSEDIYNDSNITSYPYPTQPFNTLYSYEWSALNSDTNINVYPILNNVNPFYIKSNGVWKSPTAYIKQNGTWVLQDDISGLFNENTKFAFKGHIT